MNLLKMNLRYTYLFDYKGYLLKFMPSFWFKDNEAIYRKVSKLKRLPGKLKKLLPINLRKLLLFESIENVIGSFKYHSD